MTWMAGQRGFRTAMLVLVALSAGSPALGENTPQPSASCAVGVSGDLWQQLLAIGLESRAPDMRSLGACPALGLVQEAGKKCCGSRGGQCGCQNGVALCCDGKSDKKCAC